MITVSIFWALVFALFATKGEQPNEYQKQWRKRFRARLTRTSGSLLALVFLSSCAAPRSTSSNRLDQQIAQADGAYRTLDASRVTNYNNAVATIAREIDGKTPAELRSELAPVQVKVDEPKTQLPLARYHLASRSRVPDESADVGIPMLLDYDTSRAPFYPREGLLVSATAIYRRVHNERRLLFVTGKNSIELNGSTYPLRIDNAAPITAMTRRGRHVAGAGFSSMIDTAKMPVKTGIFLTEPYDPNKAIVLIVPGLQSTPFAFADLVKAIRRDPEVSAHFQVWTFLYGTGTPVLFNALQLREELEKTIRDIDPSDQDFATRHIVVLGHSMGGLLGHTLVSSSGDHLWRSLFVVPPEQLRGNPEMAQRLQRAFFFRRNPRVVRAIFVATPHQGSAMADSWIGGLAKSLIRLPDELQTGLTDIAEKNVEVRTAEAAVFFKQLNFTSVHMLSAHDPMLLALARLPIAVPFHSIMGEKRNGAGSDGVVRYASSHLEGANSELIVRSGHNAFNNPEARTEVIRVLREELQRSPAPKRAPATMLAGYAE
jgi:pimeloyl-ACP methyl ester carboxylesterase